MTTTQMHKSSQLFHHIRDLETTITQTFPNLWGPVNLVLGAWATRLFQDQPTPLRVNLVGDPNLGSSTVREMFQDIQEEHLSLGSIPHLDQQTWEVWNSQGGNRVHFLDVDERCGPTLEEWMKGCAPILPYEERVWRCQRAVNGFSRFVGETYLWSVVWDRQKDDPDTLEWIHRFATLQATLREQPSEPIFEGLYTLAQGLALLSGEPISEGIPNLLTVTISSMPPPFGRIFLDLINYESAGIEMKYMQKLLRDYPFIKPDQSMKQLHQWGIMEYVQSDQEEPAGLKLREEWTWCQDKKLWWWYGEGYAGDLSVLNFGEPQHAIR